MKTFRCNSGGSGSPQGERKDRPSLPGSCGKRNPRGEHGEDEAQSSHCQEEKGHGDGDMRDGQEDPEVRHSPYGNRWNKRRVKPQNEDGIHINVWRERKSAERETGKKKQDETLGNWFKIIVPSGIKYDKSWLMDSLRTHCRVPFTPVDFHYVKNQAQFFVQDARAAAALKDISYKISDEDNRKICIFSNKSAVPRSVKNMLKAEELEHLELTMNKRYDDCQQSLDLQRLRYDPDLVGRDIDIILNRRNCMAATLQIIQKTFPQLLSLNLCNNKLYRLDGLSDIVQMVPTVKRLNLSRNMLKSTWEVNKIKGLKLDELWLDGNPLCDTFPDRATYVSAIRAFFPTLLRLDGKEVTPQVAVDTGIPSLIKPCKESYEGSETLKNLVLHFLQQYFWIYDYGDRQGLLGAYHEQACFSLTVPFSPEDPAPNMWQYFRDSRNIIKLKDPYTRYQLLRHTSPEIVSTLCVLPQTQHDLGSFLVDLWAHTEAMLCFSVHGVFRELVGGSPGSIRAFTETFITISGSNSSLCIVNDELFVRDATPYETQNAFSTPLPVPTAGSVPVLSQQQQQQEMVQAFSAQSGMNLQWSRKCLQDNEWDYLRAGQIFTVLKNQGKIPEEAFKPTP